MTIDTPAWVRDAVFYQIFPDRYAMSPRITKPGPLEPWDAPPTPTGFKGGDLLGIAERLPYLADLGVTALYLTPIFASASNHRYHTYDYLVVDPLLGGNDALRVLLDAAHDRAMRVILDGVFNHAGRGFWPFHHLLEAGLASPYGRWFHVDETRLAAGHPLAAYPESIPSGVEQDAPLAPGAAYNASLASPAFRRFGYRAWRDLPALPELNTDEPAVREYLFGVAEHWIRFGIDGWRLDVPEEIADPEFWQEFRRRCRALNPNAYLVGEIWHEANDWLAGDRFDAVMNYPLAEAILSFTAGEHLDQGVLAFHPEYAERVRPIDGPAFARELERILVLYDPAVTAVQLNLLGSHDTPRFLTLAGGDRAALRLAILLLATLPGAPCIYYGDEIGLEGGPDPDSRGAFPPDPRAWDLELHDFVRSALAMRHRHTALRHGAYRTLGAAQDFVAFVRADRTGRVVVALNAGESAARLSLDATEIAGRRLTVETLPGWASRGSVEVSGDGLLELLLPPREGIVLRADLTPRANDPSRA